MDYRPIVEHLTRNDATLGALIEKIGPPRISGPRDPFRNLLFAIVNQQLSMKAARTIHSRLVELFPSRRPTPRQMEAISDEQLRKCGLSGRKVEYARSLARVAQSGEISARRLQGLDDEQVIELLTAIRGIGRWTAEMYLIFGLGRPDVLPVDDLGLVKGIEQIYGLKARPDPTRIRRIAQPWRPFRSYGTWYVWNRPD
ncbi:MAG: DNA-3-methyladenine glycosylase [Candidatus Alcyoniella australis]|nr:DNA-3-methyladenine glycosylase [Candidatus Alcyoniella australis]